MSTSNRACLTPASDFARSVLNRLRAGAVCDDR
jgi:hypothetical protein